MGSRVIAFKLRLLKTLASLNLSSCILYFDGMGHSHEINSSVLCNNFFALSLLTMNACLLSHLTSLRLLAFPILSSPHPSHAIGIFLTRLHFASHILSVIYSWLWPLCYWLSNIVIEQWSTTITTMIVSELLDLGCLSIEYIPLIQYYDIVTMGFVFHTLIISSILFK